MKLMQQLSPIERFDMVLSVVKTACHLQNVECEGKLQGNSITSHSIVWPMVCQHLKEVE